MNYNMLTYIVIFSQLILFSCKNSEVINLEAAIDEFLFLEYKNPINGADLESLKSKFEKLNLANLSKEQEVTIWYYLSKISMMQNKLDEAYSFISKAYELSHADSIYQYREKINENLMVNQISNIDSTTTKIVWFNDIDNQMLMFDINKTQYANNVDNQNLKIKEIMTKGREEVQQLYDGNKYEAAINKSQMLIMVLKELNEKEIFNIELAQLYQDLAILYAKQNQLELAKMTIKEAINLNPSAQNKEIQSLLNK